MTTPASIKSHPIHAMLVPLPIGLWIFALVADVMIHAGGDPAWRTAAFYAIGVGIVGALLAAIPGLIDLRSHPPAGIPRADMVYATRRAAERLPPGWHGRRVVTIPRVFSAETARSLLAFLVRRNLDASRSRARGGRRPSAAAAGRAV